MSNLLSYLPSWADASWTAFIALVGAVAHWLYTQWSTVKTDVQKVVAPAPAA